MADVATSELPTRLKWEQRLVLLLFLGVCLACGSSLSPEEEAALKAERERKEAERKEKGFHCLSPWDGSHSNFEDLLKRGLRDPDSYEHIETRVTRKGSDGLHTLYTRYRAKNGFGGFVVGEATGKYDSQCHVVSFDAI